MIEAAVDGTLDKRDGVRANAQRRKRNGLIAKAVFSMDAFADERVAAATAAGDVHGDFAGHRGFVIHIDINRAVVNARDAEGHRRAAAGRKIGEREIDPPFPLRPVGGAGQVAGLCVIPIGRRVAGSDIVGEWIRKIVRVSRPQIRIPIVCAVLELGGAAVRDSNLPRDLSAGMCVRPIQIAERIRGVRVDDHVR